MTKKLNRNGSNLSIIIQGAIDLSIIEELEIIQANSKFDLNTLLKIASKNGAEALGFKDLGTFKKGKKPGVNLIETKNNRLQKNTKIKVLV